LLLLELLEARVHRGAEAVADLGHMARRHAGILRAHPLPVASRLSCAVRAWWFGAACITDAEY